MAKNPPVTRIPTQQSWIRNSSTTEHQIDVAAFSGESNEVVQKVPTRTSKHDPSDLQTELDKVEEWLAKAHEVPFGKKSRGLREVKRKMSEEESARRKRPYVAPKKKAAKVLAKLIYRRHALLHGFWNAKEMTNIDRGASLGFTNNKKIKTDEWEFIVRQQWKFGKSEYLDVMYLGKEPEEGRKMDLAKFRKMKETKGW